MSGIDIALNAAQSGSPVLFLDVRERPLLEAADRVALIEATKVAVETHCHSLLETGLAESLVCCSIAYLHEALFGQAAGEVASLKATTVARFSLHQAIRMASGEYAGHAEEGAQGMKRATAEQASELATWLADRYFRDAFEVLVDKAEREAKGETYQTLYKERILAMQVWTEALFASANFHQVNLCDRDQAKRVVGQLVRLDRLPKANSLEELLLLREAWCEYDVSMHLATRYKRISKLLFAVQLLLAWGIVLVAALRGDETIFVAANFELMGHVLFALSMAASLIISLDAMLNAKARWRHLRSSAGALETMIWTYRSRIGAFELHPLEPNKRPATVLCAMLNEWRNSLVASGDLKESTIARRFGPRVYSHHQFHGELDAVEDDYHSPTQPQRYIDLRITPALAFYQKRIPRYATHRYLLKLFVILCSITVTTLAYLRLDRWVISITTAASLVVSWSEFVDLARKAERYTLAVQGLKNLLSWWSTLSEVEKASKEMIARLIEAGESIISDERNAWLSTASDSSRTPAAGQSNHRLDETSMEGNRSKVHPA